MTDPQSARVGITFARPPDPPSRRTGVKTILKDSANNINLFSWQTLLVDRPCARSTGRLWRSLRCNTDELSVRCHCGADEINLIWVISKSVTTHCSSSLTYLAKLKHQKVSVISHRLSVWVPDFILHSCGALQEFITALVCVRECGCKYTDSTRMNHLIHTIPCLWLRSRL